LGAIQREIGFVDQRFGGQAGPIISPANARAEGDGQGPNMRSEGLRFDGQAQVLGAANGQAAGAADQNN
jgi:hypothetical protein